MSSPNVVTVTDSFLVDLLLRMLDGAGVTHPASARSIALDALAAVRDKLSPSDYRHLLSALVETGAPPRARALRRGVPRRLNLTLDRDLSHLQHAFAAYRSALGEPDCPYSPGSARAVSWALGVQWAAEDRA